MAHPLRIRLLGLPDDPVTATGLGKHVGESSGTTSWRLSRLADPELVEKYRRDPRPGDGSMVTHSAAFPRTARPEIEQ